MKLPKNLSCVKILTGRVIPTSEGNWETLEVKVGNELPDGLYTLQPRSKYVIKRKECLSAAHAERLWSSVRVLANLSHPNIVCYFGSLIFRDDTKTSLLIPCEYFPKGSLLDLLVSERLLYGKACRRNATSVKMSVIFMEHICKGLIYLHDTMKMVHGNLRLANILIGNDGVCRLTDISLRSLSESASSDPLTDLQFRNISSEYSPPELFAYDLRRTASISFNTSAGDMFAAGCVLTELLTGVFVHERSTNQYLCFGLDTQQLKKTNQEIAELFPENEYSAAVTLSNLLLKQNPVDRLTASKALFLMSKKPELTSHETSIKSLNGIAIEPFVVPRSACQVNHWVDNQAPEFREDEDVLSFFKNVWGDSPSIPSRGLFQISSWHTVEPKLLGSNADAVPSGQVTKNEPQTAQAIEESFVPGDDKILQRRQALSMRLCADALELQSLNQLEAAEQKFKTAIAASAKRTPANVLFEYGCFLFSRKQDIGGAESMWVRCTIEDPKHVPGLYALAKLRVNFRNDLDSAEELLKRIIDLDGRHADALRSFGILLINKGFNFEGETMLKRSLAVDPHSLETMITYGWLLHKGGRIEEAENLYLKALSHDEENPKVLSLISLLHMDKDPPPWREMNGCAVADQEQEVSPVNLKTSSSRRKQFSSNCAIVAKAPSLAMMYLEARKKTLGSKEYPHESHVECHDDSFSSCMVKTCENKELNSLQVCNLVQKVDACRNDDHVVKQHVLDGLQSNEDLRAIDGDNGTSQFCVQTSSRSIICPHPQADILCATVMKYRTSVNGLFTEYCVECHSFGNEWHVWRRFSDFYLLQDQLHQQIAQSLAALLPSRRFFGSMTNNVIMSRQVAFHKYVTNLIEHILKNQRFFHTNKSAVFGFLDVPEHVCHKIAMIYDVNKVACHQIAASSTTLELTNPNYVVREPSIKSLQGHSVCNSNRGQTALCKSQSQTELNSAAKENAAVGARSSHQNLISTQQNQLKLSLQDASAKHRTLFINKYTGDLGTMTKWNQAIVDVKDENHLVMYQIVGSGTSQQCAGEHKVMCGHDLGLDKAAGTLIHQELQKGLAEIHDDLQAVASRLPNCDHLSGRTGYNCPERDFSTRTVQNHIAGADVHESLSAENLHTAHTPPIEDDSNSEKSEFDLFGPSANGCLKARMEPLPNEETARPEITPQLMHTLGQERQVQAWESDIAQLARPEILLSGELNAWSPIEADNLSFEGMSHRSDEQFVPDSCVLSTTLV